MKSKKGYFDPMPLYIILAIIFSVAIMLMFVNLGQTLDEQNKRLGSCIDRNKEAMADYTIKCINSLQVEENAYIGDTCYNQAKSLYCSEVLTQ